MLIKTRPLFVLITLLAALSVPLIVHGAGGRVLRDDRIFRQR